MQSMLGDSLVGKDGEVSTSEALQGKGVVGLYFSAHWCPPCRGFTPKLAEVYTKLTKEEGKDFEVVFVSSDRDEEQWKEYFAEMPWLALPFADRDRKAALSKQFKVRGIPTLIMLDGKDGTVITTDGRSAVGSPESYPWVPPSLEEELGKAPLVKAGGETVSLADLRKPNTYIALYFSAHWCPPCRGFTPKLAETYKKLKEGGGAPSGAKLEVVFISSDRGQSDFDEYLAEMPWQAMPFGTGRSIGQRFDVSGIPSLVLLDHELKTVNANARTAAGNDSDGKSFPWLPKLVSNLDEDGPQGIEDELSLVALMEEAGADWDAADEALDAAAKAQKKLKGADAPLFFTAKETGGIGSQIRKFTGLGAPAKEVQTVLLNFSEGEFWAGPKGDQALSADKIADFLAAPGEAKKLKH